MGRPEKQVNYAEVEKLASRGLTLIEIAYVVGISPSNLHKKKRMYKEFQDAIDAGQAKGVRNVANSLYESAVKKGNVSAQMFYLKNRSKGFDETEETVGNGKAGKKLVVKLT